MAIMAKPAICNGMKATVADYGKTVDNKASRNGEKI